MDTNAVRGNLRIAGLVSVVILILAASPVRAQSQSQNHRSFTLAERQLLLIERMTNSVLLAALEIDASPRLSSIHWSRDRFDRMQRDLRQGDPYFGLNPTTEPEILETLGRADLQWQQYDSIFGEIVKSQRISEGQVNALAASHAATTEALRQVVASYQYFIYGGKYHSILSSTINATGQLRASTQQVLRSLTMAAYSRYAAPERQRLTQATKDFDQAIKGLIQGDPERRLLPAATPEIMTELMKVQQMWKEIQPILVSAAAGQAVTKEQVAAVAKSADDMAVPLTLALIMYLSV